MPKKVFSKHWFLFTFSLSEGWDDASLEKTLGLNGWERKRFTYTDDYKNNFAAQNSVLYYGCGAVFDDATSHNRVLAVYEYLQGCGGNYIIKVEEKTFSLPLTRVELRVYANFVGVLAFHVENNDYETDTEIKDINDFGRHIFPPYFPDKKTVCPQSITVEFKNGYTFKQDFSQYKHEDESPFQLPDFISRIMPEELTKSAWLCDDSMFYVTMLNSNVVGINYPKMNVSAFSGEYDFVVTQSNMDIYRRKNTNELNFYETLCVAVAELALAQKACYLWFTKKKSDIVNNLQHGKLSDRDFLDKLQQLDKDVLLFANNIYYADISPKRNTNKLYKQLQSRFEIQRRNAELQKDVKQLFQYAEAITDRERNKRMLQLQMIAVVAALAMLIVELVK